MTNKQIIEKKVVDLLNDVVDSIVRQTGQGETLPIDWIEDVLQSILYAEVRSLVIARLEHLGYTVDQN